MPAWMKFVLILMTAPVWMPLLACFGLMAVAGLSSILLAIV